MGKKSSKEKAPSLPVSKRIPVKKLGRGQRVEVKINKSKKQIKKENNQMKKIKLINALKRTVFYITQVSLLIGGITLLGQSFVTIAMSAPIGFSVSIPIYQLVGVILITAFGYFEFQTRRNKKTTEQTA